MSAMLMAFLLLSALLQAPAPPSGPQQAPPDHTTGMVHATVKIFGPIGPTRPKDANVGTGFLAGRPVPGDPDKMYLVLVTAAHVLDGIHGDIATVVHRAVASGQYNRVEHPVRIRRNGANLWTTHPDADIAVMHVELGKGAYTPFVTADFFATDDDFEQLQIRPGDELFTVGYPYGLESGSLGFGLLRTGRIASYPLTPASFTKTILVDFNVFGGNSGGAVFFNQAARSVGPTFTISHPTFRLIGLVTQQWIMPPATGSASAIGERLNVAVVVHAKFIREALELLPSTPPVL